MKELLKSKTMIALALFIIGIALLNSYTIKQENKQTTQNKMQIENK